MLQTKKKFQPVLIIMCTPESVHTGSLISPVNYFYFSKFKNVKK